MGLREVRVGALQMQFTQSQYDYFSPLKVNIKDWVLVNRQVVFIVKLSL